MDSDGAAPARTRAATLTSLAAELGVHVSTVSRALSDAPAGVSTATMEAVRRLAEERGYRSNLTARALRTGRTRVLGMLVPRLADPVLALLHEGVDERAIEAGYTTVVANTLDRADLREKRLDLMLQRRVDGAVVADSLLHSHIADQLEATGVPHVLALRCVPDRLCVGTDDLAGGRLVAEHLLALGHRRFGVVAGDTRASTGHERTVGFLAACEEAGVEVRPEAVVPCLFDVRSGAAATERVLEAVPDVTAIFAGSDNVALGVLGTLRDAGRSVPDDVALVGYNDLDLAAALPVPLTTVDSRILEVGQLATRMLLELLGGGSPEPARLAPRLVVRASTGAG
ncbi:substrate-binding domain-containing protein [Ornithinimicrobium humiphilum]|uniref:LacI family transcriptional regulator n=1 Tax=Ornithinimicrobium humiphilum TaxID=125288 RepID=A0A543KL83_9MICO|nr:LacI family DNA-binding transcriptional regulator [Ornithinimicrobium humiphilum]TQM95821.1 LacI family transcriptional regulator [Ornithinimicrobium humiphilum]